MSDKTAWQQIAQPVQEPTPSRTAGRLGAGAVTVPEGAQLHDVVVLSATGGRVTAAFAGFVDTDGAAATLDSITGLAVGLSFAGGLLAGAAASIAATGDVDSVQVTYRPAAS